MSLFLATCFLCSFVLTSGGQDTIFSDAEHMKAKKKGADGEMLEALLDREESRCYGKQCSHSEECCRGAACVDLEGVSGMCLPIPRKESYQPCQKDTDCGSGLECVDSGHYARGKTCQLEGRSIEKRGGYRHSCKTSTDCRNDLGFCCQAPYWSFLSYSNSCQPFSDTKECIGELSKDAAFNPILFDPLYQPRLG